MTIVRTLLLLLGLGQLLPALAQPSPAHNLRFNHLPTVWDEALPLGNATLGALVWQKDDKLRLSLDRADLWDMRPMKGLHRDEFSFDWVKKKVLENDYAPVQEYFDKPYDREPAPTKIPGGAVEFALPGRPRVATAEVLLDQAMARVTWENGMVLNTFVHATQPTGWFVFENVTGDFSPELVPPRYQGEVVSGGEVNSLVGDDLARLGYKQGTVSRSGNSILYEQEGWGGFRYRISVRWRKNGADSIVGVWSVSSHYPDGKATEPAEKITADALPGDFDASAKTHRAWWANFWSKSSVKIPNPVLEKQWYLEQYKFGSTARQGAPPISLQAVWTADNGRIPPWKGDFHHDLNTQLSYWPAYSGNHLEEAMGYLDHLDQNKANYRRYTQQYFGHNGLNVPGVTTLDGTEMGGWIQYSLSPTVSSWLAQHYYLQWRYSMDRAFLNDRAYP